MQFRRISAVLTAAVVASTLSAGVAPHTASAGSSPALIAFDDNYYGVSITQAGGVHQESNIPGSTSSPAFSPGGLELAYVADDYPHNLATIYLATRFGTNAEPLLTGHSNIEGLMKDVSGPLAFSPDGKEIAYGCGGQLASGKKVIELCTVNVATGDTDRVTAANSPNFLDNAAHGNRLSWSPDGKEIVADVNKPITCDIPDPDHPDCGNTYVGVINVKSGAVDVISDTVAYAPDLSPDGKHIIYYNPGDPAVTDKGIRVMSINGGAGTLVVPQSELIGAASSVEPDPFYSPDGKDIVFGAYGMGTNPDYLQLFRLPADGDGTPLQLTNRDADTYDGVWTAPLTTCTVPHLKGLTIKAAKKALKKNACTLGKIKGPKKHRSKRHVKSQTIRPNAERLAGTKVGITVK